MKNLALIFLAFCISCTSEQDMPRVVMIYPSSDTLPENLLRMYIQFSEPMKTVGNLEKIRLFNEEGEEISGAIFSNVYELWSADQTQLTLVFDPARVKTGLRANELLGRALQQGEAYELLISNLENIEHERIKPFSKKFKVSEADLKSPNLEEWKMIQPKVNTTDPFKLIFPEIIDQMSLRHRLVIVNESKEVVKGIISVANNETEWSFIPSQNWIKGTYSILINARLADPSGNNLNGLFDHPIHSLKYEQEGEILRLSFEIHQ